EDLMPSSLKEGQRIRIYLSRFQERVEFTPDEDRIVAREEKTDQDMVLFSAVSASSWGELFQKASLLLSRDPGEVRHPQIFYRGKDWSPERTLEDLRQFLSALPLREGQSLEIKAGRGNSEILVERKGDLIHIRVQQEDTSVQSQVWIPDLKGSQLRVLEPPLGRTCPYQSLEAYHAEALRLVKQGLGNREISEIISRKVNTQLPVETLVQSPPLRGRFLAVIAEESLKNRAIPRYLEQWIQVHRFIESAYAHLDLETIQ